MHYISKPKVSIIMPVYNTEAYLRDSIESVLAQTLSSWELIIVNDGSTDGSLKILEYYASKDERIRLIDQENSGQSAARNRALEIAQGEYVYFLDSDDEIVSVAIEKCYKSCEKNDLDFVFFDADMKYDEGMDSSLHNVSYSRKNTESFVISDGLSMMNKLLLVDEFLVSPCLVFTKRSYIDKQNFSFYEGIVHEDELYTSKLFLCASRVMYIPCRLFIRRLRSNSTMTAVVRLRNIMSYFVVAGCMKELAKTNTNFNQVIDLYLRKTLNAVLWKSHTMSFSDRLRVLQIALRDWSCYINKRTWVVLLLKKYIKKR